MWSYFFGIGSSPSQFKATRRTIFSCYKTTLIPSIRIKERKLIEARRMNCTFTRQKPTVRCRMNCTFTRQKPTLRCRMEGTIVCMQVQVRRMYGRRTDVNEKNNDDYMKLSPS
jgi:hypothetical protein